MKVSERVKLYCEEQSITYMELAKTVGMTSVSMARLIDQGRLPQILYLKNIAIVLGISLDELMEDE